PLVDPEGLARSLVLLAPGTVELADEPSPVIGLTRQNWERRSPKCHCSPSGSRSVTDRPIRGAYRQILARSRLLRHPRQVSSPTSRSVSRLSCHVPSALRS